MCLEIPYKVLEVRGNKAIVEAKGDRKEVLIIGKVPRPGDFVIVKSNAIVEVIPKESLEDFQL